MSHDRNGLARLNKDGSVDTSFDPGTGASTTNVNSVALAADLKVVAAGSFTRFNGVPRQRVVRVFGDTRTRIQHWDYRMDGRMELTVTNEPFRSYVVEASNDAVHWAPVETNSALAKSFTFVDTNTIAQAARFYRILEINP